MQSKTKNRLKELYKEYQDKHDDIMRKYGEKDGFIIQGIPWWDYYRNLIDETLKKIKNNAFNEDDALRFYKIFGFGPKWHAREFLENGLERIKKSILYLADKDISAKRKFFDVAEHKKSELFLRGIDRNFVTLFLASLFPQKYGQWNTPIDKALKSLKLYPKREREESRSEHYTKLNSILLDIKKTLSLGSLPIVDNLLYCVSRGYVGIPEIKIAKKEPLPKLNIKDLKTVKIVNVHIFRPTEARGRNFWQEKCEGIERGIYIYWLAKELIFYPFTKSPIFYIGKAQDLSNRLRYHFSADNDIPLIEGENARSWSYQNYYFERQPFHITILDAGPFRLDDLETLFIGVFILKYGAMPLCNGQINRDRFAKIYNDYPKSVIKEIKSLLGKLK